MANRRASLSIPNWDQLMSPAHSRAVIVSGKEACARARSCRTSVERHTHAIGKTPGLKLPKGSCWCAELSSRTRNNSADANLNDLRRGDGLIYSVTGLCPHFSHRNLVSAMGRLRRLAVWVESRHQFSCANAASISSRVRGRLSSATNSTASATASSAKSKSSLIMRQSAV